MTTKALLASGVVAGPLFTVVWITAGATRVNYDPYRHPISSLSIGDSGWLQIASFVATGLLVVAFSIGVRRVLRLAVPWGPRLIGLVGIGLIGAGIFVTDPLNGYPPGTPPIPAERTTHGVLHDLFSVPFFLGLPIAGVVFSRHFARRGARRWAAYSAVTGVGMFVVFFFARLSLRPGFEGMSGLFGVLQRITVTMGWAWLTLLAVHLLTGPHAYQHVEQGPHSAEVHSW